MNEQTKRDLKGDPTVPSHQWIRRLCRHGRLTCLSSIVLTMLLVIAAPYGAGSSTVFAQDDLGTPTSDDAAILEEEPAEAPSVDDAVDQPVEPTPAVEEPATEEPPPAPADTPDDPSPADDIEATETPIETPTPATTAVAPSLNIQQAVTARCALDPGELAEVGSGGSQRYGCTAELGVTGSAVDPARVAVDWAIDAGATGAWTVQLRTNADRPWSDPTTPPVLAAQTMLDDVSPASDGGFQTTETTTFELLVTRALCDTAPTMVEVRISATPSMDGTPFETSALPEPLRLEPALAAIGQPTATVLGSLDFGTIGATAAGPDVSTLDGALELAISGMNTTCGAWQITIGGTGMVDAAGAPLSGSELLVLPSSAAGVPCDVRTGCPVAMLTADPVASPVQTIVLDLQLRLGDAVVSGSFSTSLTVTMTPLDGAIETGNGE